MSRLRNTPGPRVLMSFYTAISVTSGSYAPKLYGSVPIVDLDDEYGEDRWRLVFYCQHNEIPNGETVGIRLDFGCNDGSVGFSTTDAHEVTNSTGATKGITTITEFSASEIKALTQVGSSCDDARVLVQMRKGSTDGNHTVYAPYLQVEPLHYGTSTTSRVA